MTHSKVSLENIPTQSWLDTHREPFVLIDADYTIVAANSAYARAYGTDTSSLLGRKCHQVSHRSAKPCHHHGENCPHQTVFATGHPAQVVHTHFDVEGHADRVRLSAAPFVLPDGTMLMSESVQVLSDKDAVGSNEMVGASPAFLTMLGQLTDVAASTLPVLLTGETGAGKELAAQFIHRHSPRHRGPLIVIDCTSIPESLFEAELFGHEKGAFTGPSSRRIGLAEDAAGGTLFLDEIGELPSPVQAKLLRFAETGEVRRLGANKTRHVDCRIISATHRPLSALIGSDRFRSDLFYRLAGVEVRVPSLAERGDDVLLIAEMMLQRLAGGLRCRLSKAARQRLRGHPFPGNVRELRNVIQRATQRAGAGPIEPWHLGLESLLLPADGSSAPRSSIPSAGWIIPGLRAVAEQVAPLSAAGLSRRAVAERLGVSERTIYRHLARLEREAAKPKVPERPE